MLLEKEKSCLLLIDVQKKLMPHVQNYDAVLERCQWLMRLAKELRVPLLVTEQYPKGLDYTVEPLRDLVSDKEIFAKVHFSCFRTSEFKLHLQSLQKKQLVLIGIETHVCVLQSALDLRQAGYEVFVVVDAVGSRSDLDYKYGLKRMKQEGIHLLTSEMVFFEWVEKAGTPEFKALSTSYLK